MQTLIYITSLTIIGLNLPYNQETLLGGSDGAGTSPFVIMANLAGLNGLDHLVSDSLTLTALAPLDHLRLTNPPSHPQINITICISVLSIGLSCVYAGSRVLTAMAETGFAPKIFTYVDKSGRPLFSVIAVLMFGPIAYVNVVSAGDTVFNWLLGLSGLSTLFTWGSICMCHIRFRKAWRVQGHHLDELPYKAIGGVYGSWCGFILVCLVLVCVRLFPFLLVFLVLTLALTAPTFTLPSGPWAAALTTRLSAPSSSSSRTLCVCSLVLLTFPSRELTSVRSLPQAAPVLLAFWLGCFLIKRTLPYKAHEIDLDVRRSLLPSSPCLAIEPDLLSRRLAARRGSPPRR